MKTKDIQQLDELIAALLDYPKKHTVNWPESNKDYGDFLLKIGLLTVGGEVPSLWKPDMMAVGKLAESIQPNKNRKKFRDHVLEKDDLAEGISSWPR